MGAHCSYEIVETVGLIKIDSGKVNAFSHGLIDELHEAFNSLRENDAVKAVVLTGKEGFFSAGFDLKVMGSGMENAQALVKAGGQLLTKLYLYEKPLVIASSGHAMAMGAISLFVGDVRIGAEGSFKVGLNETAIGMALPWLAVTLAEARLRPTMVTRAVVIGEIFDPKGAIEAGYYDLVASPETLLDTAMAYAAKIGDSVEQKAYAENKRRVRAKQLESVADIWD